MIGLFLFLQNVVYRFSFANTFIDYSYNHGFKFLRYTEQLMEVNWLMTTILGLTMYSISSPDHGLLHQPHVHNQKENSGPIHP